MKDIETSRRHYEDPSADAQENRERFYKSTCSHNPEQRLESARKAVEYEAADERARNPFSDVDGAREEGRRRRAARRLVDDDGRAVNVNTAGLEVKLVREFLWLQTSEVRCQ